MRYADGPTAEVTVHVDAPPRTVWPLVADIHLVAESSTELQEVTWLDEPVGDAVLGCRFRGRNLHPKAGEWSTTSHVAEYEPERVFGWVVEDPANPTATWRLSLRPDGDGTELRQWARMGPGPSNLDAIIAARPEIEEKVVAARLAEWTTGMERTVALIKERAES